MPFREVDARQMGDAHQMLVDRSGRFTPFVNRPDDERLTAPQVARGEHIGHARHVVCIGFDIAARIELESQIGDRPLALGTDEAHR